MVYIRILYSKVVMTVWNPVMGISDFHKRKL